MMARLTSFSEALEPGRRRKRDLPRGGLSVYGRLRARRDLLRAHQDRTVFFRGPGRRQRVDSRAPHGRQGFRTRQIRHLEIISPRGALLPRPGID